MQQGNIRVSRPEVIVLSDVNKGYSSDKHITAKHNLTQVTTESFLLQHKLPELARAIGCVRINFGLSFKDVENEEIIKELSIFSKLYPEFFLEGSMQELTLDESDHSGDWQDTLMITVKNSQVEVVIL